MFEVNLELVIYQTNKTTTDITQSSFWWHWYLGFLWLSSYPGAMYGRLTYPYWGRRRRMNPSKIPATNPPMCAILSIPGINPIAMFTPITKISIVIDTHWRKRLLNTSAYMLLKLKQKHNIYKNSHLICVQCPVCDDFRKWGT